MRDDLDKRETTNLKPKTRVFTPIDFFVQTYAMDHRRKYTYKPGDYLEFKTSMMSQEDIEELIEAVKGQGLRVQFNGQLYIYEPDEDDEEPEAIEPDEEHRAPTPEELETMAIETLKITREELQAEADRIEEKMRELGPVVEEPLEEHARTYEEVEAIEEEAVEIEVEPEEKEEDVVEIRSLEEIDQL